MTDYSELVERMRACPASKFCVQIADALEAQAKEIAELDKAAKDAIKEVSYWSTETGKRDARIADLEVALKPFADAADIQEANGKFAGYVEMFVYVMDLYVARAALAGLNGEK